MSTEIETDMKAHSVVEFWGGNDRGVCLQITAQSGKLGNIRDDEGFIQLTLSEACALANTLAGFVARESRRRQKLLAEHMSYLRVVERTVFDEVLELNSQLFEVPSISVRLVDQFCPKVSARADGNNGGTAA